MCPISLSYYKSCPSGRPQASRGREGETPSPIVGRHCHNFRSAAAKCYGCNEHVCSDDKVDSCRYKLGFPAKLRFCRLIGSYILTSRQPRRVNSDEPHIPNSFTPVQNTSHLIRSQLNSLLQRQKSASLSCQCTRFGTHLYFIDIHHGKLLEPVTMSRVTYFTPHAHTGNCVS